MILKKKLQENISRVGSRPHTLTNLPIKRFSKEQAFTLPGLLRWHLSRQNFTLPEHFSGSHALRAKSLVVGELESSSLGSVRPLGSNRQFYGIRLGRDRRTLYAIATKKSLLPLIRLPFQKKAPIFWSKRFRKFIRNRRSFFSDRRTLQAVPKHFVQAARRRGVRLSTHCFVYMKQTVNNTFITVRDRSKVLVSSSCGSCGFTGPRRPLLHSTTTLSKVVGEKLRGKTCTIILLSRITSHIRSAIVAISKYMSVYQIKENLPIAHNGIRSRHIRRI